MSDHIRDLVRRYADFQSNLRTSKALRRRRGPGEYQSSLQQLEQRIVLHQPHDPTSLVALSPDFENDGEMFTIFEGRQLLKSVDGGRTYFSPRDPIITKPVTSIVYSPNYAVDQIVFAGTETEGVLRSTDRGETWSPFSNGILDLDIHTFAFSPDFASDQTVFVGTHGGFVYRSVNGGSSWEEVYADATGEITDLELSPNFASDQTLLISQFDNGVLKSTDGGESFLPFSTGLSSLQVQSLALPANFASSQLVLAGTTGGVFVTFDAGQSWSAVSQGIGGLNIVDVEIAPNGTGVAVSQTDGVFIRTLADSSWRPVNSGIREFDQAQNEHYYDVTISPTYLTDNTAFVATFGGLYRTHTPAPLWVETNVLNYRHNREVQISPDFATDKTIFAATWGGGLMKSTNVGEDWTVHSHGMTNVYMDNIAVSPDYGTDQTVFTGNFLGVFKSTDGGDNWTLSKLRPDLEEEIFVRDLEVSPNFANDQLLIAGTSTETVSGLNGAYRSIDGGETWTQHNTGLPAAARVDQIEFSPDFATDNTVFAGVRDAGVYKSTDGGLTWAAANTGIAGSSISRLRTSPTFAQDQTLFAVSAARLVRSTDGGATWTIVDTSFLPGVTAVTISPSYATDSTVWIGAGPYGVYRSSDGGATWNSGSSGLDRVSVNDIVVSPDYTNDGTLVVGTSQGAFRSTDGGDSFTFVQTLNRYEDEDDLMYFVGSWNVEKPADVSGPSRHVSSTAGATLELQFYGGQISWLGSKGPDHGRARVTLDGQVVGVIDLYDPVAQSSTVIGEATLENGWHTLVIEVLGTRNSSSTGTRVSIDAFDVIETV